MMKKKNCNKVILFISVFFIALTSVSAQVYGKIIDKSGQPLPFAAVYIKGTTQGTFSNEEGEYLLNLNLGKNKIVYKFISYQTKEIAVDYKGKKIRKDISLDNDDLMLKAVVIKADVEDPAYAIIRKAIKSRKTFKNKPENFKAEIYQKLKLELLDAPKKIFGVEIAKSEEDKKEMDEVLDTSSNVVLVTETVSEYYQASNNKWKETIISSKISGDKTGYSNMSSLFTNISFYNNYIPIGKKLISPISSNAMLFYKYKLIGFFKDDNGNKINKIQVIPKRKYDPTFRGYIFIVDDVWNIYGLDLEVNSKNTNIRLLDTIRIKQDFRQLTGDRFDWGLLSQYAAFDISFMGFKANGYHTRNFVNYELNQNYPDEFFNKIKVKVEEEANKRDSIYWEKIRPVPLSVKERKGYVKMDSIEAFSSSKEYLDSIDRKENKFKLKNLLTSYTFSDSYNKSYWKISSPITKLNFNPVQGLNSIVKLIYIKEGESKKYMKLKLFAEYGHADKNILPGIKYEQMIDSKYNFKYIAKAGRIYSQPSDENLVNKFLNMVEALFDAKNYLKLYDKKFINLKIQRNFVSGISTRLFIEYNTRAKLSNHTNYSFFKDIIYKPNIYEKAGKITYPNKFIAQIAFSYKPGVEYIEMPNELTSLYSPYPRIVVEYTKAISRGDKYVSYDFVKVGLNGAISTGLFGYTNYFLEAGKFLTKSKVDKLDDHYFSGNQMYIMMPKNYKYSFHLLPFYTRADFRPYFTIMVQQKLKGLIIEKIPYINRLKMEEVFTFKLLQIKEKDTYYELGAGLDKIFGILSFRYSWAFNSNKYFDRGIRFSLNLPISFVRE